MLHKNFDVIEVKAEGESGEFTAIVSTFGNVDRVGDRIMPGAWTKTLAQWVKSGDPIPIILAHQWNDPFAHVGYADPKNVTQVAKGLQVKGKLDVEDNPVAKQVHKLMKRRSLKEFSIGYDVPPGGESRAKDGANEISEINLAECGPCLKGIDPKTELQDVKAALGVEDAPLDAGALRKESERLAREIAEARLPEVKAEPGERDPEPDLIKELQALKSEFAATRAEVEALKKKAEEADKEPTAARSVDPLRKRGEELALEVSSGGMSLRRPPKQVKEPAPDLVPLDELRRASRDLMTTLLSDTE